MPETLPVPEIIERNSERTITIVLLVIAVVVIVAQLVVMGLSASPLVELWPWLVAFNVPLAVGAGIAWGYIKQRAPKHASMAQRLVAEVYRAFVAGGGMPSAPVSLAATVAPTPAMPDPTAAPPVNVSSR